MSGLMDSENSVENGLKGARTETGKPVKVDGHCEGGR